MKTLEAKLQKLNNRLQVLAKMKVSKGKLMKVVEQIIEIEKQMEKQMNKTFKKLNDDYTETECVEINKSFYLDLDNRDILSHTDIDFFVNASECFNRVEFKWEYSHSTFQEQERAVMESGFAARELGTKKVTIESKWYINQFGEVSLVQPQYKYELKEDWLSIAKELVEAKKTPQSQYVHPKVWQWKGCGGYVNIATIKQWLTDNGKVVPAYFNSNELKNKKFMSNASPTGGIQEKMYSYLKKVGFLIQV